MPGDECLKSESFQCTVHAVTSADVPYAITYELSGNYLCTEEEAIRCTKCRGYISPYCEILSPGDQWRCALCRTLNTAAVPFVSRNGFSSGDTFSPLRNCQFNCANMRDHRLTSMRLEMPAVSAYLKQHTYVFAIECTTDSYKRGIVDGVCEVLVRNICHLGGVRVAFIFYGRSVCIAGHGGVVVVSDFEHLPVFNMDDVLFDTDGLPDLRGTASFLQQEASADNNLGGVLSVVHAMLAKTGGTVLVFLSTVPNIGRAALSTAAPSLRCKNDYYKNTAASLSKCSISLSYYVFSCRNVDLPSLGLLSRFTGGFIAYFPNFDTGDPVHPARLNSHVHALFRSRKGYEGVLRVRGSNVHIIDYFGNFHLKASDVLSFCTVNFDHSITFTFRLTSTSTEAARTDSHDDLIEVNRILNEIAENDVFVPDHMDRTAFVNGFYQNADDWLVFQVAMMYSDESGGRRLRLNNFIVPVVRTDVRMVNEQAMAHLVFLRAINEEISREGGLALVDRATNEQPEGMARLLLGIKKSVVLRPVSYTPMDYRAFYVYLLLTSPPRLVSRLVYPLLYDVHGEKRVELSLDSLEVDNFYILDAGYNFFFFAGAGVHANQEVNEMVTGCFGSAVTGRILLQEMDNEQSRHLLGIVRRLRQGIALDPNYYLVRDDGSNSVFKDIFFSYFYDDEGHNLESLSVYARRLKDKK